jgi:phospholipid/cholesterol/gamma-HCH transport system permease protein
MKVTEQIDAMVVSGVNPYKFLASTRILACIVALPLLTLAAHAAGVLMGVAGNSGPATIRLWLIRLDQGAVV